MSSNKMPQSVMGTKCHPIKCHKQNVMGLGYILSTDISYSLAFSLELFLILNPFLSCSLCLWLATTCCTCFDSCVQLLCQAFIMVAHLGIKLLQLQFTAYCHQHRAQCNLMHCTDHFNFHSVPAGM